MRYILIILLTIYTSTIFANEFTDKNNTNNKKFNFTEYINNGNNNDTYLNNINKNINKTNYNQINLKLKKHYGLKDKNFYARIGFIGMGILNAGVDLYFGTMQTVCSLLLTIAEVRTVEYFYAIRLVSLGYVPIAGPIIGFAYTIHHFSVTSMEIISKGGTDYQGLYYAMALLSTLQMAFAAIQIVGLVLMLYGFIMKKVVDSGKFSFFISNNQGSKEMTAGLSIKL